MKTKSAIIILTVLFLISILLVSIGVVGWFLWKNKKDQAIPHINSSGEYDIKALSFTDFTNHLDFSVNTSMHIDHFWGNAKGKQVKWSGEVIDVKGGRARAEITIANKDNGTPQEYNIVLTTYKLAQAAALKKGETIVFTGQVKRYKGSKGRPIIVYLDNCEVVLAD